MVAGSNCCGLRTRFPAEGAPTPVCGSHSKFACALPETYPEKPPFSQEDSLTITQAYSHINNLTELTYLSSGACCQGEFQQQRRLVVYLHRVYLLQLIVSLKYLRHLGLLDF